MCHYGCKFFKLLIFITRNSTIYWGLANTVFMHGQVTSRLMIFYNHWNGSGRSLLKKKQPVRFHPLKGRRLLHHHPQWSTSSLVALELTVLATFLTISIKESQSQRIAQFSPYLKQVVQIKMRSIPTAVLIPEVDSLCRKNLHRRRES